VIDMETLDRIAAYAKLRMQDGDLEKINETLAVIDRIHEIPLDRDNFSFCAPSGSTSIRLREDIPRPSMPVDDLLRNAPRVEAGCISVPKVLGGES
jgi:aspartyl-tRNA(Asn)/glutamyl-tRNA(Gln) amidotransferase subunit C